MILYPPLASYSFFSVLFWFSMGCGPRLPSGEKAGADLCPITEPHGGVLAASRDRARGKDAAGGVEELLHQGCALRKADHVPALRACDLPPKWVQEGIPSRASRGDRTRTGAHPCPTAARGVPRGSGRPRHRQAEGQEGAGGAHRQQFSRLRTMQPRLIYFSFQLRVQCQLMTFVTPQRFRGCKLGAFFPHLDR